MGLFCNNYNLKFYFFINIFTFLNNLNESGELCKVRFFYVGEKNIYIF
jgi:hypothetical protein